MQLNELVISYNVASVRILFCYISAFFSLKCQNAHFQYINKYI